MDQSKTAQFLSLLTGKALNWATMVWEKGGKPLSSYNCFIALFCQVFNHALGGKEVGEKLLTMKQGRRRVVKLVEWLSLGVSHASSGRVDGMN